MITDPRCKALTPARWYKSEPTQCKMPAWKDGYCRKHHPLNRAIKDKPLKEIAAARKSLESAEKKVAHWTKRIAELEAEQKKLESIL